MAKNSRDVELVIRAKDAASKTIDDVADSLKTLQAVQDKASNSAKNAGTVFDRLSGDLKKLDAEAKGLAALGKVAGEIDKASAAITRLEAAANKSTADLESLKTQQAAAGAEAKRLATEYAASVKALNEQKAATTAAKKAQSDANAEYRLAEQAVRRLETRIAGLKAPTADLVDNLARQKAALQGVAEKQQLAIKAYTDQKAALESATKATSELKAQASSAANNVGALETASNKVAASIERQNADLEKANAAFNELKAVAGGAQQALGGVAISADQISAASTKAAAGIAQINAALARQNRGSGSAPLQGSKLVLTQLEAQKENVQRSQQAFEAAQKEVNALAAAMRVAGAPVDELGAKFALAAAQARKLKDDLIAQQAALGKGGSFAAFDQAIQKQQQVAAAAQQSAQVQAAAARQAQAAQAASTASVVAQARANLQAAQGAGQLANNFRGLATASTGVSGGMAKAASATTGLKGALSAIYGESRQALSLFQRIRGEVLALAASYVGLFAAIQSIGGVINAYRTIEAAQNRLGAAFEGNSAKVGEEMRFLQVQASRLGIEFGVLSNEYAKFAIAAQAANFPAEDTRKIFLSVAEAARVQKLSLEDTQGVFLALQQIISKGKVSSEELRRQLGDRLPGAFNIFADAIGMTTAELDKALQKGEVFATNDTLLKFADQLDKRFGAQLPKSLQTLTTEIGRFQNSLFNAQAQIARGGFAEALREGLVKLNEFFRSQEGVQFFSSLGAALGKFINLLTSGLKYIDQIIFLFKAFAAIKIAQTLQLAATSFTTFAGRAQAAGVQFRTFAELVTAAQARLTALGATANAVGTGLVGVGAKVRAAGLATTALSGFMGAARGAVLGLANGLGLLVRAAGGWVGIALTIASFALANYFTSTAGEVDKATAALEEHERIMQEIGTTYESTGGKIDDFGAKLKNVSLAQAQQNFKDLNAAASEAFDKFKALDTTIANRSRGNPNGEDPQVASIKRLVAQAQSGQITITAFRDKLNELSKSLTSDAAIEYAAKADKLATTTEDLIRKTIEAGKVTADLGSTTKDSALASELFAKQLEAENAAKEKNVDSAGAAAAANQQYYDALTKLIEAFPALKKEADAAKTIIEGITAAMLAFKAAIGPKEIQALVTAFASLGTGGPLAFMQALAAVGQGDFSKLGEVFRTIGAGIAAQSGGANSGDLANLLKGAKGSLEASAMVIKQFEGFKSQAYYDVNAFRAGFGSDTITLADGSIKKITEGMSVSMEDAQRDLIRRIGEFQQTIIGQIGAERFSQFTDQQQAALTSIAYNYGSLPQRIVDAIKTGNTETIGAAIRNLGSDNGGVNAKRRSQEASLFLSDPQANFDQNLAKQKEIADEAEREAKAKADAQAAVQKSIEQGNFEVAQLQETARQAAINKAVREQELKLQEVGLTLSQQQREQIAANAAAQFDAANKEKAAAQEKELIEKRVNDLYELRKQLQENITFAQEQGDTGKAEALKQQLTDTDAKLKEAIADAQTFYSKMGGPEADLAIQKLQGMNNSLVQTKQSLLDAKAVNDLLVNGLSNAFSSIAQNIATVIQEGGSLKDVLKGIGQAFLKFAADFLLQLGQMIVKQALFNALAGGQSGTGGVGGFLAGIFHGGGIVGRAGTGGQRRRKLPASLFNNAPRFHSGGIVGLGRDEIPAVLKRNEEVLSQNDPRNALNGGLAAANGGGAPNVKIVNAFDASSYLTEALNSRVGEKAILNAVRANSRQFKQALEG